MGPKRNTPWRPGWNPMYDGQQPQPAPQPTPNVLAGQFTGQPWRPLPGDMVQPAQRYTYTSPFPVQDPMGGARPYGPYNPLSSGMSGNPFRDPMSGGYSTQPVQPQQQQPTITGQPPPYWMVP